MKRFVLVSLIQISKLSLTFRHNGTANSSTFIFRCFHGLLTRVDRSMWRDVLCRTSSTRGESVSDGRTPGRLLHIYSMIQPHLPKSTEVKRLRALLETLSEAEYGVLLWLCEGKRNSEIATILGRSRRTVESHVASVIKKLEAETRGGAVRVLIDWHIATSTPLPWPDEPQPSKRPARERKAAVSSRNPTASPRTERRKPTLSLATR